MSTLEVAKIDGSLRKKGFHKKEGDHLYYIFTVDGKKTSIFTKISHSSSEIGDSLISCMSRQLHLSNKEFKEFVDCHITFEDYKQKMKEDGIIDL